MFIPRAFTLSFAASKKDTALVSPFQRILPSIFPSTIHLNFSSSFLCPISPRLPRIPSSFFFPSVSLPFVESRRARAPPLLLPSYRSRSISLFSFLWPSLSLGRFVVSFSTLLVSPSLFLRALAPFTRSLVPSPRGEDAIFSWPLFFHGLRHPSLFFSSLLSPQLSSPILSSPPLSLSLSLSLSTTPATPFSRSMGSFSPPLFLLSSSPYTTRRVSFSSWSVRVLRFSNVIDVLPRLFSDFFLSSSWYHRTRRTVILETTNQLFLRENVSGNGFSPPAFGSSTQNRAFLEGTF